MSLQKIEQNYTHESLRVAHNETVDVVNTIQTDLEKVKNSAITPDSLPIAGESLGAVKSGGDVTIDENGIMTVNDNSHNHTVENIEGLEDTLNSIDIPDAVIGSSDTGYIIDSAEASLLELSVYGKSTQDTSTGGEPAGKNLIRRPYYEQSGSTVLGITYTINNDGSVTVNGTTSDDSSAFILNTNVSWFKVGQTYTISGTKGDIHVAVLFGGVSWQLDTFTVTEEMMNADDISIRITVEANTTVNNVTIYPQLELGSTATTYEQYVGKPTPEAPIPIVSVGDDGNVGVTACGKNLFDINGNVSVWAYDGSQVNANSVFNNVLTATYDAIKSHGVGQKIRVKAGTTVTFSAKVVSLGTGTRAAIVIYETDQTFDSWFKMAWTLEPNTDCSLTYTAKGEELIFAFSSYQGNGAQFTDIQVEVGNTSTAYEPYKGNAATITSGLPLYSVGEYRDELIYNADGTGKIIKRVGIVDMGTLDWFKLDGYQNSFYTTVYGKREGASNFLIAEYKTEVGFADGTIMGHGSASVVHITDAKYTDAATFKTAMSGIMLYYQLATPQEITLSAAEIAELQKLQTFDGITNIYNSDNTEMDIKYWCNESIPKLLDTKISKLMNTVSSSETITVTDSVNYPIINSCIYGKSTQDTSTGGEPAGKNLFDINGDVNRWGHDGSQSFENSVSGNVLTANSNIAVAHSVGQKIKVNVGSTVTFSAKVINFGTGDAGLIAIYENNNLVAHLYCRELNTTQSITYTAQSEELIFGFACSNGTGAQYTDIQVEIGSTATVYKPYVGKPTPEAPIPIVSVGDDGNVGVTACGKNLIHQISGHTNVVVENGVVSQNKADTDTSVKLKLQLMRVNGSYYQYPIDITAKVGINTIVFEAIEPFAFLMFGVAGSTTDTKCRIYCNDLKVGKTYTLQADFTNITQGSISWRDMQIELGTTATAYEPYKGNAATITSGLPLCSVGEYRDELIYNADGTGKIIKRIKKVVFDGSETNWVMYPTTTQKNRPALNLGEHLCIFGDYTTTSPSLIMCDKYKAITYNDVGGDNEGIALYHVNGKYLSIYDEAFATATIDEWKAHLATNPLTVIYVLNTPQEITLSAAEMAELQKLQTFDGITNIYNSDNVEMNVSYLCDNSLKSIINTRASINHTHTATEANADPIGSADKALQDAKAYADIIDTAYQYDNLIKNGYGEHLNNTNFVRASFIRDDGTCPEGCYGFFNGGGTTEPIPFDKNAQYEIEYYCRRHNGVDTNRLNYFSILTFDVDGLEIKAGMSTDFINTDHLFYLSQDLNVGDTVVHFTDLTYWVTTVTQDYQRSFLFYGYTDSTGYTYPDGTYSRNIYFNTYASNDSVDKTNNTITLTSPWSGKSYKAGTCVCHVSSGSTYLYYGQAGVIPNTEWKKYNHDIYIDNKTASRLQYTKTIRIYLGNINADYCGLRLTKKTIDKENRADLVTHTSNNSNPHNVTKVQVGLGNVENKSSATIRGEITKSNVTTALGYTPMEDTTVPVTKGGTGATNAKAAEYYITEGMPEETDEISDTTLISFVYADASTTKGRFYWRKAPYLWNFIKNKISSILGLTNTQYNGNAKTATTSSSVTINRSEGSGNYPILFTNTKDGVTTQADAVYASKNNTLTYNPATKTLATDVFDGAVYESKLKWGGCAINGDISPIDAAASPVHSANRFQFANPDGITIEYSRDNGSTWTTWTSTNNDKIGLVSNLSSWYGIGGNPSTVTVNDKLRITLNARSMGVYTSLKKLLIDVNTNGAAGSYVKIEHSAYGSETVFGEVGTYLISGWSGWNSIPYEHPFGSNYIASIRLTFGIAALSATGHSSLLIVKNIVAIGPNQWGTPSTMATTGNLYSYDAFQNATFPSQVTSTTFNGPLNGNAATATKADALSNTTAIGSATNPVYIDATGKPVKTTYTLGKSVPSDAVFTDTKYTLSSFGITATATELNYTDGVTSNIQTQLDNKAPLFHSHNVVGIPDTRSDNRTPEWYFSNYPKMVITEFKESSTIGLSGETYIALTTYVPWSDSSGGYPKQTVICNGVMYYRVGTSITNWSEWEEVSVSGHTHNYVPTTGGTMTGALVGQANTNYTTAQFRNITMSTSEPTGGANGQIHFQYS